MIELPIKTVSLTNQREHWRVRARRVQYQRAAVAALLPRGVPVPCTVTLTRISPGILDDDNLPASLKSVRDEIASRSGIDDRDPRVKWCYAQERGKRGDYLVRVEVA